jgi:D-alanyl-D-alanine carboxypeptidase
VVAGAAAATVPLIGCQHTASSAPLVAASHAAPSPPAAPSISHSPKRQQPTHRQPGVRHVSRHFLGSSWHRGCPVPPSDLRAVTLHYWGFDRRPHLGTIVVNATAVRPIRAVFHDLRQARFPVRRLRPVTAYGASDSRSVRHDNTSAFNCRFAVANGPKHWSEHAFGEAVDLDPRENPYVLDGKVLPRSAARFADRTKPRRGVILTSGPAVQAFASVGWGWGGRWSNPDYQHFSVNGR